MTSTPQTGGASATPPYVTDRLPELRAEPPWVMEEMVEAEPALARSIVEAAAGTPAVLGDHIREALERDEPVAIIGCGTSEHAAHAVAELLRIAARSAGRAPAAVRIQARQAFEAALDPWGSGLCVGITHEGRTDATVAALRTAGMAGARTAVITAVADTPSTDAAGLVIRTPLVDASWCHTVGYLSPIVAGAVVAASAAALTLDGEWLRTIASEADVAARGAADEVAGALVGAERLLIAGSGADLVTARELALKLEEGAHLPAVARDSETWLHGHLTAVDERAAFVLVTTAGAGDEGRATARGAQLLASAGRLGAPGAIISTEHAAAAFSGEARCGRIVVPTVSHPVDLQVALGRFVAGALALQRLVLAVIARVGTNPDRIRREQTAYREAAELAFPFPG